VLEIPAHEGVDPLDRCGRNVPSILQVSRSYNSDSEILLGELRSLRVELYFFYQVRGHRLKDFADPGRRPFELGQGKVREDECVQGSAKPIEELSRVDTELLVEATSDSRGVSVDSASHGFLFYVTGMRSSLVVASLRMATSIYGDYQAGL